jgi:hypothetical protein
MKKVIILISLVLTMNPVKHLRLFLDVRDYVSFFDFAQHF